MTIVGWGKFGSNGSNNCKETQEDAGSISEGYAEVAQFVEGRILTNKGDNVCSGDSGGSLYNESGQLVGVTSGNTTFTQSNGTSSEYSRFIDTQGQLAQRLLKESGLASRNNAQTESTTPSPYRLGIGFKKKPDLAAAYVWELDDPSTGANLEVVPGGQRVAMSQGDLIIFAAHPTGSRTINNANDFKPEERINEPNDLDKILAQVPFSTKNPVIYFGVIGKDSNTSGSKQQVVTVRGVLLSNSQ